VKNNGDKYVFGNSEPCSSCTKLLKRLRVKQVFYSLDTKEEGEVSYVKTKAEDLTGDHVCSGERHMRK